MKTGFVKTGFGVRGWSAIGAVATSITLLVGATATGGVHLAAQQQRRGAAATGVDPSAPVNPTTPDGEHGQAPPVPPARPAGLVAYPDRPKAAPEAIAAGKATYSVNCAFCHGSDAGGGSIGPNLLRSDVVLQDKRGELIMPIVHGARVDRGMPKIDINDTQVAEIADWLHSLHVASRGNTPVEKINIVVGSAPDGKVAFDRTCGSCHSVTGDLKGFAAKFTDPRAMQQSWIMPVVAGGRGGGAGAGANAPVLKVPPVTATVTQANGQKVTGVLDVVDDFYVAVVTPDGETHRFSRWNDVPKVEIHDPLAAHRDLLRKYNDKDIHDITAYLETLK